MNSENIPKNIVDLNSSHCQLMARQVKELETRVLEMEKCLLNAASRLHDDVSEKLEALFGSGTIVEFEAFTDGSGRIDLSENKTIVNSRLEQDPKDLCDMLERTRKQLQMLSETIDSLQLPR